MSRRRYDLVVLGAGTGGLVSAQIAAGLGARVALIERERPGGDCLWTGCVPSKSLLAAAELAHRMTHADAVGLLPVIPQIDFSRVMDRVRAAIATLERHDSPERLREAGIELIEASGRFLAPGRIQAGARELRYRAAIIATGSQPALPPIPGLADARPLSTDTVWELRELPRRLVLLGGGPVGCELGQAFARLGAKVTVVELLDRLLPQQDPAVSELIAARLRADGVELRLGRRGSQVRVAAGGGWELVLEGGEAIELDRVLVATGRSPRTADLGLDAAGVRLDRRGAIAVDGRLQSTARGVFAVGDVTALMPFTHVAAHHARVATPNALFHARGKVSRTLPSVVFTDPEVAQVGLSEAQARERWGGRTTVASYNYSQLDRAVTAGQAYGFAKLIADPRGRLVGATIAAPAAGEAIAALTAWVSAGAKLQSVSRTVHAYPTLAEGPARAADAHLAARYSTPALRAIVRPLLGALRLLER